MDTNELLMNSQRLTDMRVRMLQNVQAGKPVDDGIDETQIRVMLDGVRAKRAEAWERGQKKTRGKKAKGDGVLAPSATPAVPSGPLSEKAAGLLGLLDAAAVNHTLGSK